MLPGLIQIIAGHIGVIETFLYQWEPRYRCYDSFYNINYYQDNDCIYFQYVCTH